MTEFVTYCASGENERKLYNFLSLPIKSLEFSSLGSVLNSTVRRYFEVMFLLIMG